MNKKLLSWVLMITGAVLVLAKIILTFLAKRDFTIEISNRSAYDFFNEYGVGLVVAAFFAGIILFVIGLFMYRKVKIKDLCNCDIANMPPEEVLLFHQESDMAIIVLTNKNLWVYTANISTLKKTIPNLPEKSKVVFPNSIIASAKVISSADVKKKSINPKFNSVWGIQIQFTNNNCLNIPFAKPDELVQAILKIVKS